MSNFWIDEVKEEASEDSTQIIIGNKVDMASVINLLILSSVQSPLKMLRKWRKISIYNTSKLLLRQDRV